MAIITPLQAQEMLARCARNRTRQPQGEAASAGKGEDCESVVRRAISEWCAKQWPVWVILTARTDVPSTLPEGAHDLTIFGPFPVCILVETKRLSGGKLSAKQLIWIKNLEMLKWKVAVIRTIEQFLELANA